MSSTYPSSSVVRGAVILGACVAVFAGMVGWRLVSTRQSEVRRYSECSAGTRSDCEPSLFWLLAGLAQDDGSGRLRPNDAFSGVAAQKRVMRTSDQAPVLTSVKPDGFTPEGQGYAVTIGNQVTLTATVENAKQVEVRFLPAGQQESVLLKALTPVEGKEFTYEAQLPWTETRAGDLEIRAVGEKEGEQTQMFLPLRIQAVADKK